MPTRLHLVRHGEVENPKNIWYGTLEGFELSDRGRRQAEALGRHFAGIEIDAIYSSPLARALQTATPISESTGVRISVEEGVTECFTRLEGKPGDFRVLRNPFHLRHFLVPSRPSWGEPYVEIRKRMSASLERMLRAHEEGEVIVVSHMTPILIARLWAEGDLRPPWRAGRPCTQASVTSLEFHGCRYRLTRYREVGKEVS